MTDLAGDYFINQELVEEMVRLMEQAAIVTQAMGGVFSEQTNPERFKRVLDLACGPGEWVMGMARTYPHMELVGVDKSKRMIDYASACAEAEDQSCHFRVMDVTQAPLDFPQSSFDLINARFILGFMKRDQWPLLLRECYRLLVPGGVIRVTEQESGVSNSPIYQRYIDLWGSAWRVAGHAFSHTPAYIGVTVVLKQLMRQAGFVGPEHRPILIDLSAGEPNHKAFMENLVEALTLASPWLLRLGVTTQESINEMADQMKHLIDQEEFAAYWLLNTLWALKPHTTI